MNVFLSHSYDDNQIAQKVRNYLEHHGLGVFDDKNDITTGANLNASINEAINVSDAVLFFISKNSDKSRWVQQEMSLAVSNKFKGKDVKLIPIVIEKNVEIPFFLKDYVYLDISGSSNFEDSMSKLIEGITTESKTSIEQDISAKISNIEIETEVLQLKILEHQEYEKLKTRKMFLVSAIVTLVTSIVASLGFLVWVAKIEYPIFEFVLFFLVGAVTSMAGTILYMEKERSYKDEINKKIDKLHDSQNKIESHNDK